jgi:hypothetical protein
MPDATTIISHLLCGTSAASKAQPSRRTTPEPRRSPSSSATAHDDGSSCTRRANGVLKSARLHFVRFFTHRNGRWRLNADEPAHRSGITDSVA